MRDNKGQYIKNHQASYRPKSSNKKCSINDCNNKYGAKGFCKKHYLKLWLYGDPLYKGRVGKPRSTPERNCEKCGKSFYRSPSQGTRFCSRECSFGMWRGVKRGSKPLDGRWRKERKGYIASTIGRKRIWQHRYIVEQAIGRPLEKHEIIHHINGIKHDNRIENLHITNLKEHPLGYGKAFMEGYDKGFIDGLSGVRTC